MTGKHTTRMYSSMYGIYAVPGYINVCIAESSTGKSLTNIKQTNVYQQILSKQMFSM